MRQIVLDTETTGMNKQRNGDITKGHRIIEIACVEIIDKQITGKIFHTLLDPGCEVDPKATKVHGLDSKVLKGMPRFQDICRDLLNFIGDSDLIIHNAPFDTAFLDKEFYRLSPELRPCQLFTVIDTLQSARELFRGEDNTLNALSLKFQIDVQRKDIHTALIDAEMLARVYLKMV